MLRVFAVPLKVSSKVRSINHLLSKSQVGMWFRGHLVLKAGTCPLLERLPIYGNCHTHMILQYIILYHTMPYFTSSLNSTRRGLVVADLRRRPGEERRQPGARGHAGDPSAGRKLQLQPESIGALC